MTTGFASFAALSILGAAMLLAMVRLLIGPSQPDRIVALDLMAVSAAGFSCAYAVRTANPMFLDVAIVLALVAFLGTVAFARYLQKGGKAG